MKRKCSRELPILWEAVKAAFDRKICINKWFTPMEYVEHGAPLYRHRKGEEPDRKRHRKLSQDTVKHVAEKDKEECLPPLQRGVKRIALFPTSDDRALLEKYFKGSPEDEHSPKYVSINVSRKRCERMSKDCLRIFDCERIKIDGVLTFEIWKDVTLYRTKHDNFFVDIHIPLKTRKIGLKPTKQQRETLDTFLRGSVHAYNFALRLVKDHGFPANRQVLQRIVSCQKPDEEKAKFFQPEDQWYLEQVPSSVKQIALTEFTTNWERSLKKRNAAMKYKDKDCHLGEVFGIKKAQFKVLDEQSVKFYPKHGGDAIRLKTKLTFEIDHDVKVQRNACGKYYLLIPIPLEIKKPSTYIEGCMVGIDPGVRSFVTIYDPSRGKVTEYGKVKDDFGPLPQGKSDSSIYARIKRSDKAKRMHNGLVKEKKTKPKRKMTECRRKRHKERRKRKQQMNSIINKIETLSGKRDALLDNVHCTSRDDLVRKVAESEVGKRKLKRYDYFSKLIHIARYRQRNKVTDLHHHVARKLVDESQLVVLGRLEVSNFKKDNSQDAWWATRMRKNMRLWAHYRFREYLLHKAREVEGCEIVIQDEKFTSQTCGLCGTRNRQLGSNKTFHCTQCSYVTDRDVNGARNILKKHLGCFNFIS